MLLNRQWIIHSWDVGAGQPQRRVHDPSWLSLFILPISSWFCPIQNRACTHTSQERECTLVYAQGQSGNRACLGTCKIGLLHIHLGGCGLRLLIDSCELHNTRHCCACLSHNLVCYNQIYVTNIYELLMGSWLPKVTWGHCWELREYVLELENLWLVCIHCVPRALATGVEKVSLVIFIAYLWTLQGVSTVGFRDQLVFFLSRPPLLAHA